MPVTFFAANEEYGTWVDVPGLGTYSHTSDVIAPADSDFGPSLADAGVVSWPEFRRRRLAPLQKAGGRLVWQFGENEELTRLYLDDSLARGGYAAVSTFHFGNPDFTNSSPFLIPLPRPRPVRRPPGRARPRALVVRGHDGGVPHPLPGPGADLGRVAGGPRATTELSPSVATR